MRVRFKNEKELRTYGLVIDPSDRNRALPAKLAEQCPILGQSRTLGQLIAVGKEQWADIQKNEKYLTGRYWDFAGTLQEIKDACGKDIHAWAAAYRAIGIDRRRASELLLYRKAFNSRQEAASCPVLQANRLIRQTHQAIDQSDDQETIDAVDVHESPASHRRHENVVFPALEDKNGVVRDNSQLRLPPPKQGECESIVAQSPKCGERLTLDQIKCAIAALTEHEIDALYMFITEIIGRRMADLNGDYLEMAVPKIVETRTTRSRLEGALQDNPVHVIPPHIHVDFSQEEFIEI